MVEQPVQGIELEEKPQDKDQKHVGNLIWRKAKIVLLILDLKPFSSYVYRKHSVSRELQSHTERGKWLLTKTPL